MASIEKRVRDGQASRGGRTTARPRVPSGTRPSTARSTPSGSWPASSRLEVRRDVRRPDAGEGHRRRVGRALARRADPPQAVDAQPLRGHRAPAHPPAWADVQARQRHPRRRAGLGHRADRGPVPRHGPQDPPGAQPDPRPGRPGRTAGPQRRRQGQPAATGQARAALPHPRARSTTWPTAPATPPTRASTAAYDTRATRCTGSSCCSWPTPASGSARWPRSGSAGSTCDAPARRHRRVGHAGPGQGPGLGHAEDPPAPRGADPAVPGRRARRARRGQGARRPGLRRHPQRPAAAGQRPSGPRSAPPPGRSASPTCTRTSCGTPRPASPSPPAPTSRSSSRCSATRSATMTLDTYGHLFEDRLDEVADAMDRRPDRGAQTAPRAPGQRCPAVAPVLPEPRFRAGNAEEAPPSVSAGQGPFSDLVPPTGFEPALPP